MASNEIFTPADILLPRGADLEKWSVVACDQFTSERAYWDRLTREIGDAPSALHMIIPEAYLGQADHGEHAARIGGVMRRYLEGGVFDTLGDSFIYIERVISDGRMRRGIVGRLDLECYDFTPGTRAPVRASEHTVLDRLPPRVAVRREAPIELPHVMALLNDPEGSVIEAAGAGRDGLRQMYDFSLSEGGGRISGWQLRGGAARRVVRAIQALPGEVKLIIGDGNHSLAAAKKYWEEIKAGLTSGETRGHPARYALLEVNNVYDPAITFEPIHRAVFGIDAAALAAHMKSALPQGGAGSCVGLVHAGEREEIRVAAGSVGALVGAVQAAAEAYVSRCGGSIDYIHGEASLKALAERPDCLGIALPRMDKSGFFDTVMKGGVFPKKSFSIGEARDKRYYLECRRIRSERP